MRRLLRLRLVFWLLVGVFVYVIALFIIDKILHLAQAFIALHSVFTDYDGINIRNRDVEGLAIFASL